MLSASGSNQTAVATQANISQAYLNQMMTGRRKPLPRHVELVAVALNLNVDDRLELNMQAARDYGFKI